MKALKVLGYAALLAGAVVLNVQVKRAESKIEALHASEQVTPVQSVQERTKRIEQKVEALARQTVAAEQAARIEKSLAEAFPEKPAKPTPVTGYVPGGKLTGTVYSNADLKPDLGPARVIIDFSPEAAAGLEYQAAVKSGRCAGFSFVPNPANGKRVNRLYCDPVVAR